MRVKMRLNIIRLFTLLLITSCANVQTAPLRLQDQTLLIDQLSPDLIHPYNKTVCKYPRRVIFKNCKVVREIIHYDLSIEKVRAKLNAAKFKCQSPLRFRY